MLTQAPMHLVAVRARRIRDSGLGRLTLQV